MYSGVSLIRYFGSLLTTLTFLSCSCTAKCPTRNEALPLDLDQLSGEWLLVAGTPVNGKSLSKCGRFNVSSLTPDTFVMDYTGITHEHDKPVALIMNAKVGDDVVGDMQFGGSNRKIGPFNLRVIALDYDSYFVMVVCSAKDPTKDFSMILSRDINLPPPITFKLKSILASYFDEDAIVDFDHINC